MDEQALWNFITEHRLMWLKMANKVTRDLSMAEEAVGASELKLYLHRNTLQNAVGWMQRTVKNQAIEEIRRRDRQFRLVAKLKMQVPDGVGDDDGSSASDDELLRSLLEAFRTEIPKPQWEAASMRLSDDPETGKPHTFAKVAEKLGISEEAAKKRFSRFQKKAGPIAKRVMRER